jgi:hypothetical protein
MTSVMASLLNRNYSRRTRRLGVLLMYTSYPGLFISSFLALTAQFSGWPMPVRLLCWTLLAALVIAFFVGTWFAGLRGIRSRIFPYTVGASDQVLDERQRVAKYRAYRIQLLDPRHPGRGRTHRRGPEQRERFRGADRPALVVSVPLGRHLPSLRDHRVVGAGSGAGGAVDRQVAVAAIWLERQPPIAVFSFHLHFMSAGPASVLTH